MDSEKTSLRIKVDVSLTPKDIALALYQLVRIELEIYPGVELVLGQDGTINGLAVDENLVNLLKAADYLSAK